ncbi:MAG: hypothetical protein ACRETP_15425, partial [Steroidobacteraceae bacterium]
PVTCPLCNGQGSVSSSGMGDLVFDYLFPTVTLLANQQGAVATLNIANDYDFEVTEIKSSSTGLFSVQLSDQFRNTTISNLAINGENFSGTAQLPRVLFKPWKLLRTSSVQATFNDRSGAGNTIQLALGGYKLSG